MRAGERNFMVSGLKKKKKKAAANFDDDAKRPWLLSGALLFALAAVGGLAIISTELAVLALGLTALSAYITLAADRQNKLEDKFDRDFAKLQQNHQALAQTVSVQGKHIQAIRQELKLSPAPRVQDKEENKKINLQIDDEGERDEKPPGMAVANDDLSNAATTLSDMVIKELLHNAVRHERVDVFIQPVVRLPQRKMRFFEIYSRIRAQAGIYLPASRYMGMAEKDRLVAQIDNLLLLRCLAILRGSAHIKRAAPFFINVGPGTLKDPRFMRDLLQFVSRHRDLAKRLIFEMRHEDFDGLSIPVLQILDGLGKVGCSFSLDHVNFAKLDVELLQKYRVRYVKIHAKKLLAAMDSDKQFQGMMRFKRKLESNGIGVIAEKIEDEYTLKELLDYDIHYGQGYLFGKPELEGAYRARKAA